MRAVDEARGIVTESWSPLGKRQAKYADAAVSGPAERLGVTPGQVILRWQLQVGAAADPEVRRPRASAPEPRRLRLRADRRRGRGHHAPWAARTGGSSTATPTPTRRCSRRRPGSPRSTAGAEQPVALGVELRGVAVVAAARPPRRSRAAPRSRSGSRRSRRAAAGGRGGSTTGPPPGSSPGPHAHAARRRRPPRTSRRRGCRGPRSGRRADRGAGSRPSRPATSPWRRPARSPPLRHRASASSVASPHTGPPAPSPAPGPAARAASEDRPGATRPAARPRLEAAVDGRQLDGPCAVLRRSRRARGRPRCSRRHLGPSRSCRHCHSAPVTLVLEPDPARLAPMTSRTLPTVSARRLPRRLADRRAGRVAPDVRPRRRDLVVPSRPRG